jgi:hypothetical protein
VGFRLKSSDGHDWEECEYSVSKTAGSEMQGINWKSFRHFSST